MKIALSFAALALLIISAQAQASISTDALEKATGGYSTCVGGACAWVAPSSRTKTPDGGTVTTIRDTNTHKNVTVTRDASGTVTKVDTGSSTSSSGSATGSAQLDAACTKYLMNSGKATATAFKVCGQGGKLAGKIDEDGHDTGGGSDMSEKEKSDNGIGSYGTTRSADQGFNNIDTSAFGGGSPSDPNHNTYESLTDKVDNIVDKVTDVVDSVDDYFDSYDTDPDSDTEMSEDEATDVAKESGCSGC